MPLDILVKNVALWGTTGLSHLGIANGRFVSVGQSAAAANAVLTLDAGIETDGVLSLSGSMLLMVPLAMGDAHHG